MAGPTDSNIPDEHPPARPTPTLEVPGHVPHQVQLYRGFRAVIVNLQAIAERLERIERNTAHPN